MLGTGQKIGSIVAACAVALAVTACGPPVTAAPSCSSGGAQSDAVSSVVYNRANADHGGGLGWNAQLACLAFDWSTHLGNTGSFYHRDLNAQLNAPGYGGYSTLGENILVGLSSMDGNQIEDAFMNSPEHRANILSRTFNSVGVGVYYAQNGNVYVTQNFGG